MANLLGWLIRSGLFRNGKTRESGEMPKWQPIEDTGWLNENGGRVLRRDEGGRWRLDVGFRTAWRSRKLIGKRVRIIGERSGFDLLDVERVEAL